jgi:hypothetical protein
MSNAYRFLRSSPITFPKGEIRSVARGRGGFTSGKG